MVTEMETGGKPEVEIEEMMEEVMTEAVLAVFFPSRKRKDEGMIEHTDVVNKRLRVPSSYLSSPFTTVVKKRTFVDGSKIDLFQKVDPSKEIEFLKWYSKL
ncbi:hypothetical protein Adt_45744 [Abeliophyllum distichum]|uniref:Uncharacterized protein n=1 Tax=Abeliophyllum distichum TaxID=126358 RepID=A0ABD1PH18_9LAMI